MRQEKGQKKGQKKGKRIGGWLLLLMISWLAADMAGVRPGVFLQRGGRLFDILDAMFPPDWTFAKKAAGPLAATIQMAFSGTVLGGFAGLALACACTESFMGFGPLRMVLRAFIQLVRTIPALVLALLAAFVLGIGTFAGTGALFIYTAAILAKLGYEDMENAPAGAYEALLQSGCGRVRAAVRTILPEMLPSYLSNALYMLESNVRSSAILGYVGAGGVGLLLNEKLSWRQYEKAGMVLVLLFAVVAAAEGISEYCRIQLKESSGKRIPPAFWCLLLVLGFVFVGHPESGNGLRAACAMAAGILHPDWTMLADPGRSGVVWLLFETVCIAWAGTVLGAVLSLPLAFAGSVRLLPVWAAVPVRLGAAAVRTIPVFIYGLMFIRVTGPGAYAGVMTLGVVSTGLLTKRFQTAVDSMDLGPWRALRNAGVSWTAAVRHGLLPQLIPAFASAFLYRFDVNIREASVLGLVGAGGIGAPLILAMNQYKWNQAGALLLGLAATVLVIGNVSSWFRKRISA